MTTTTTISFPYPGNNQIARVDSTYGVPVTAHIWGAGGGSTALYPGAGGGYSQVSFVAKPGDNLEVTVGQGGGAGGVTQPPPVPPATWSTRVGDYTGTTLYPAYPYNTRSALLTTYGVWNNPQGLYGSIDTTWASVAFPVSGYYTIQGSSNGCGFTIEPQGGGTLYIDGADLISLPGNFGGGTQSVNVYVTAGIHSVRVYVEKASNGRGQQSSVAFVINQTSPTRIPNTPAGLAGASYIALMFNSRFPPAGPAPVYAYGNGDTFLDQWGVWNEDQNSTSFIRQYTVSFLKSYTVVFQMASSNAATLIFDGSTVITRTAADNPNTPTTYRADFAAGTYIMFISATGVVGALNRVGVTLSNSSTISFSGGRGGISDPTSKQGFGAGGGGASVVSVNTQFVGVGAGGGGGAGAAPTNITYITTKYTGSLSTQPFVNTPCGSVITPGTSGYYVYGTIHYDGANEGSIGQFSAYQWCVVLNGVIVYGPASAPPPENTVQATQFVGWSCYDPLSQYNDFPAVECFSFNFTSLDTSAITNVLYNGQNGQDEFNFNTPDTGGGGGGGGGARGGNGGAARGSGGGGYSGHNGLSLGGTAVFPPNGRLPYVNEFYPGGGVAEGAPAGTAANGGNGYVILIFQTGGGGSVKDGDEWKDIQTIYVNDQGAWKNVKTTFINDQGVWKPVQGGKVPAFRNFYSLFGQWPREYSGGSLFAPPPPAPDYTSIGGDGGGGSWGGDGGGGSGGCFLTTATVEAMGLPDDCEELMLARELRNHHMGDASGERVKHFYKKFGPLITERNEDWKEFYHNAVVPITNLIKQQKYEAAKVLYKYNTALLIDRYASRYEDKDLIEEVFAVKFGGKVPYAVKYAVFKTYLKAKILKYKIEIKAKKYVSKEVQTKS
jgi:hypothetical protein